MHPEVQCFLLCFHFGFASFSLHLQVFNVRTVLKKTNIHVADDAQNQDTVPWSLQVIELEQEFRNPVLCPLNYSTS